MKTASFNAAIVRTEFPIVAVHVCAKVRVDISATDNIRALAPLFEGRGFSTRLLSDLITGAS